MLQMILRRLVFLVIGKAAGGQAAKNVRLVDKATRMARRLDR
ncbi:hypothetical protein SAMN05444004_106160 [Jannaschia faecimaris]|uniref:Uncharacterized protein n=1 Tax=Jannaschia faecimaris TaxID=1244108 RepID=A0A1H3QKQ8_9RHOB|nr:hypothetical protein [Jannaschia faecimaris]SDZ13309.1 hypothetical protein SAMN05444004_106160 [Jannaschia faecimaris]